MRRWQWPHPSGSLLQTAPDSQALRDARTRDRPPRRAVDPVDPKLLAFPREFDRLSDIPAALSPIGARYPDEDRQDIWPSIPHDRDDLERKPHPVLQRSSVPVFPPVDQRRQELAEQIAVGGVDFDYPESRFERPPSRVAPRFTDAIQPAFIQCYRGLPAFGKGNRGRRPYRRPSTLFQPDRPTARPRCGRARLSPGMSKLNPRDASLLFDEARDMRPSRPLFVAIDSSVHRRDSSISLDSRRLREDEGRTPHRPAAEMDEVPVVWNAVDGAVLAHR